MHIVVIRLRTVIYQHILSEGENLSVIDLVGGWVDNIILLLHATLLIAIRQSGNVVLNDLCRGNDLILPTADAIDINIRTILTGHIPAFRVSPEQIFYHIMTDIDTAIAHGAGAELIEAIR